MKINEIWTKALVRFPFYINLAVQNISMTPSIIILNGPNLNKTGVREPDIYGTKSMDDLLIRLQNIFEGISISYKQSNIEGTLINILHDSEDQHDGVVFNPGGYSHTSVAIADAIAAVSIPVIEVHISNVFAREPFRHNSLTAAKCIGNISGFGLEGYIFALYAMNYHLQHKQKK